MLDSSQRGVVLEEAETTAIVVRHDKRYLRSSYILKEVPDMHAYRDCS